MIICGYPGIGKSSVAKDDLSIIDLESSCMINHKNDYSDWSVSYTAMARHLSDQGYIVFLSSHSEVISKLEHFNDPAYIIYPSVKLEKEWVDKLNERYKRTNSIKDYRAYERASKHYRDDILAMSKSTLRKIELSDMDYNLKDIIYQIMEDFWRRQNDHSTAQ